MITVEELAEAKEEHSVEENQEKEVVREGLSLPFFFSDSVHVFPRVELTE